jgi:hypothetical protein
VVAVYLYWVVYVDLHHFVCIVFGIVPKIGPWWLEDACIRNVYIGNVPKSGDTGGDEVLKGLPRRYIAVLKGDRTARNLGDVLLCFRHELQVANQNSSATFMAESRQSEANTRSTSGYGHDSAFDREVWDRAVLHTVDRSGMGFVTQAVGVFLSILDEGRGGNY